jgi:hypothetical protein
MIVKCLDSKFSLLSKNSDLNMFISGSRSEINEIDFSLRVNEQYLVVAISIGPFCTWMFIDDRFSGLRYPRPIPSGMFSITDSRISRFWMWGTWCDRLGGRHSLLASKEWVEDEMFHGKLFEGDALSLERYYQALTQIRMEYPIPWISDKAYSLGSEKWVGDEIKERFWEADPQYAMTLDPLTNNLLHNPLFSNEATNAGE